MVLLSTLAVGCQDGESSQQAAHDQQTSGWAQVTLEPRPRLDHGRASAIEVAAIHAATPLQKQRLAVSQQLVAGTGGTPGFEPNYVPMMDRAQAFRISDQGMNSNVIAIVPVEERGVAHAYQQNLVYVAIISGEKVTPIATLVGSDAALLPQGLKLWRSSATGKLRLFLVSCGPTFQGSASLCLNGWEIEQSNGVVTRLIALSGPETILDDDAMSLNVGFEKAMTVDVRLGAAVGLDVQQSHRASLLEVEYTADSVEASLIGTYAAKIVIP